MIKRIVTIVPWPVAGFVLVVGFCAMIAAGLALVAHSHPFPHPCGPACHRQYAWMRLPTGEIVGIGAGVGVFIYAVFAATNALTRRRRGISAAMIDAGVD